jgi:homogentisate 1,2-dioxygenase
MPALTNGDVTVSVSRRRAAMPFCWRNVDADELYFIHRGPARFETEMGWIDAVPGDFVYLSRNMVYRVIPQSEDSLYLILETKGLLEPADRYHRDHGETNAGLDLSQIVVPEPGQSSGPRQAEYEVRTKIGGQLYSMFFDYDPVGVTVGWSGDPIAFKLSAWDVPSASLPSTPPTAAVFVTEDWDCVVTVHTPMRGGGRPSGPPAHTNDYDEIWFLHASGSPERNDRLGLLRWEPQGWTQPGFVRRPETNGSGNGHAPAPPTGPTLNLNIDVHRRMHVTGEAEAYRVDQRPAVATAP